MKLGIGTVQFGLDYGISNKEGRTPENEVVEILRTAPQYGISVIDTAALYGTSEEVLGRTLPTDHKFEIITKTPGFSKKEIAKDNISFLEETFYESLKRLNQRSIYGLLVHNADDILTKNGYLLVDKMNKLKEEGLVKKIGVSVYTAEQINRILERYQIDLIQLPVNVLDQRLILSGHLLELKKAKVEVHARSIFLQGLLLLNPEELSNYFDSIKTHLNGYHEFIKQQGLSPVQAAIGFVMGLKDVDAVIFGVNNLQQLKEVCTNMGPLPSEYFSHFGITDEFVLNPVHWNV